MARAPDWQAAEERPLVVLGAGGMLATAIVHELEEKGVHYLALSEQSLDITFEGRVAAILKGLNPGIIINTAAYTDVDGAETSREQAFAVNSHGADNVARAARSLGSKAVHISTDYVFDGKKEGPYRPDDEPDPINIYGQSKLEGEIKVRSAAENHLIIRTAWIYGPGGKNFVRTILGLGRTRDNLRVVNDQTGSPTFTRHLAGGIIKLASLDTRGTFHLTNSGQCTWYEFACEILRQNKITTPVHPVTTEEFPTDAKRPRNSLLDCKDAYSILGGPLPHWQEGLRDYLELETGNGEWC